jgi:hypothetical protein
MNPSPQTDRISTLDQELRQLADEEREGLVRFLQRLDAFDREMGWAIHHPSLWQYLLEELHIREASAQRRIQAMRLLRKYPQLASPLADGRLCLSTLGELSKVMTPSNVDDLVAKAANLSFRKTQELVVAIQPRPLPAEGIRRLPAPAPARAVTPPPAPTAIPASPEVAAREDDRAPRAPALVLAAPAPSRPADRVEPIAKDLWSVRLTLDREGLEELERFLALTSHKNPRGNLSAAMREALRCGILVHGKRRGAVKPERTRKPVPPTPRPRGKRDPVPAAVRREVWARDGGRCAYVSPAGKRCDCTRRLQFHHRGGALRTGSTAKDLELRCKSHDDLDALRVFGREHIQRRIEERRRMRSRKGESTTDVGSTR